MEAISEAWIRCVKHTTRGTHSPSFEEQLALREARWRGENEALRRSLAGQQAGQQQRLRESMAQWQEDAAAAAAAVAARTTTGTAPSVPMPEVGALQSTGRLL